VAATTPSIAQQVLAPTTPNLAPTPPALEAATDKVAAPTLPTNSGLTAGAAEAAVPDAVSTATTSLDVAEPPNRPTTATDDSAHQLGGIASLGQSGVFVSAPAEKCKALSSFEELPIKRAMTSAPLVFIQTSASEQLDLNPGSNGLNAVVPSRFGLRIGDNSQEILALQNGGELTTFCLRFCLLTVFYSNLLFLRTN
jgi:hypothetical protein